MTAKTKKQWTLIASSIMTLATFWYSIEIFFLEASFVKIVPAIFFGISSILYWYRYKTETFEDD